VTGRLHDVAVAAAVERPLSPVANWYCRSVKLYVYVHDKPVATLESPDGFRHVMTYHPDVPAEQFVSLLMPVRTESYVYPELHPLFRMNLPEGFLLSILQEQLGPHVGASPLNLLSVVGRNAIGRVKVATPGSDPAQPPVAFELNGILRGDNSEEAFVELVRKHATSGVSGVVPKFLSPSTLGEHGKGTLCASQRRLPHEEYRFALQLARANRIGACLRHADHHGLRRLREEPSRYGR